MNRTFNQRGKKALTKARDLILLNCTDYSEVSKALHYFSNVTLQNALPVFPALISLACETSGGNPKKTIPFAEAIVLVTGAADLHDDVIDNTIQKGSNPTVLGKFGLPVAILAGDVLLVQGVSTIERKSAQIKAEKGDLISNLLKKAILEISAAEASEAQLRKRLFDLSPKEYYLVIRHKAVVHELAMNIGAILGNASSDAVESLGQIGRTFGIISTIVEEFIDLFDIDELRNRIVNGCPPLPLIYVLQTAQTNNLLYLLDNLSNEQAHNGIVETVLNCHEVKNLINENLASAISVELLKIRKSDWKTKGELETLFLALQEYLNDFS